MLVTKGKIIRKPTVAMLGSIFKLSPLTCIRLINLEVLEVLLS